MAPPSPLAIATSSVQRLVKEETSYHKELKNQEARLEKLVNSTEEDENAEYQLKQEVSLPSMLPLPKIYKTQGEEEMGDGIEADILGREQQSKKPKPCSHRSANAS
jgi:hypothetical protein